MRPMDGIRYSVVIPVNNEEDTVALLVRALTPVMESLGAGYELIMVDDGSTDRTLPRLRQLAQQTVRLTVLSLGTQQGKGAALQAGMDRVRGEILMMLDGDLQDDPREIPHLLQKLDQGYDVVCGWRFPRRDPFGKKFASFLGNLTRRCLWHDPVHDVGCSLRVFRRAVLSRVEFSDGRHRWFTWLAAREGFRIGEVKVRHHPRQFGHTHYGMWDRLLESCVTLWHLRRTRISAEPKEPRHEPSLDRTGIGR